MKMFFLSPLQERWCGFTETGKRSRQTSGFWIAYKATRSSGWHDPHRFVRHGNLYSTKQKQTASRQRSRVCSRKRRYHRYVRPSTRRQASMASSLNCLWSQRRTEASDQLWTWRLSILMSNRCPSRWKAYTYLRTFYAQGTGWQRSIWKTAIFQSQSAATTGNSWDFVGKARCTSSTAYRLDCRRPRGSLGRFACALSMWKKCTFDKFLFTGRNFFVMQNCK